MKGFNFLAAAALFASLSAPPATAQDAPPLQLIDLTDDYERIWTETQTLPESQRVAHFKQSFAKILPGFYDAKRFERLGVTPVKYDESVAEMLVSYPTKREDITRVAREIRSLFAPALASFESKFGPMRGYPPIYFVNSHNEFDGGTRDLPEGNRLLFGADVIAKFHSGKPIQPFFHHELFHLYHGRNSPDCEKVWCNLWSEGLATYVASTLNPTADDQALLLTFPVPLRAAVEEHRTEAVCAVLARLDSEKSEDYAPMFTGGGGEPLSTNLPRRFGYYVGLVVAQDLGKTRSLKELAEMNGEELRAEIESSLRRMADCSA